VDRQKSLEGKPFDISKREVWEAYERVKANKGAPGVDGCSIEDFESDLRNNLYKIWNRMSSGSYFPPAVRAVEIPKSHGGGTRILGVPTVADLARRRYLAVDPANRLVADTLEADWNTALRAVNDAQNAYDTAREQHTGQLTDTQRARISQLVTDLPAIWNDPATPARERKRIARLLLTDV